MQIKGNHFLFSTTLNIITPGSIHFYKTAADFGVLKKDGFFNLLVNGFCCCWKLYLRAFWDVFLQMKISLIGQMRPSPSEELAVKRKNVSSVSQNIKVLKSPRVYEFLNISNITLIYERMTLHINWYYSLSKQTSLSYANFSIFLLSFSQEMTGSFPLPTSKTEMFKMNTMTLITADQKQLLNDDNSFSFLLIISEL